jgi:hypothetical protein
MTALRSWLRGVLGPARSFDLEMNCRHSLSKLETKVEGISPKSIIFGIARSGATPVEKKRPWAGQERPRVRIRMLHKLGSMTAWGCLLFVTSVTLSPVYLRPRLIETEPALIVILEHVGAFAVIGFLFSVTYTRTTLVCLLVFGSAVILELLQLVVPDRDARVIDVLEKLIGGGVGIFATKIVYPLTFADSKPEPAPGIENEIG